MRLQWRSYGGGRDAGVCAYAVVEDGIVLRFRGGEIYLYDSIQPGAEHVEQMLLLAESGSGLTTYVNRFVQERYRRKLG